MRQLGLSLAFLATLVMPALATAQDTGADTDIDLQDFLPTGGPRELTTVPSPIVAPHATVGFGVLLDYASRPLTVVGADGDEVNGVASQLTADFLWSFGLWDRLQLGLALPIVVSQSGEGIVTIACEDPNACDVPELAPTAIRDLRADAKVRFGTTGIARSIALGATVSLPTGDDQNFGGSKRASVMPMLVVGDLRATPQLRIGAAVGARIREERRIGDATFGSEVWGRAGLGYEVVPRLTVSAEYFGTFPLADGADERMELLGAVRYAPDRGQDVTVELGAGTGLSDADGAPGFRGIAGISYAPLRRDTDSDGVPDATDTCLAVREDRDGFEDTDGCPDADNDDDGIADPADRCDDQDEDSDGFQDADGCPDPDNDDDGVLDADDRCPEPEDRDEHEDEDGCLDPDDDGDQVPDAADGCRAEPEDRDGFEDANGCPDPDNDADGMVDAEDVCPDAGEDRDGNEDDDGCPDPDDDQDGVLDAADQCRDQAETINGRQDDDGCPDPGGSAFAWQDTVLLARRGPRFAAGATALPDSAAALVAQLAQTVRAKVGARFVVHGFGDRAVDDEAQRTLARGRADALKAALVAGGVAAERITAEVGPLTARRSGPQFEIRVAPPATSR